MEKIPKTPKKSVRINFDFSDDSDEFFTPSSSVAVKTNTARSFGCEESSESGTMVPSEYLRRKSELPLLMGDMNLPAVYSTKVHNGENKNYQHSFRDEIKMSDVIEQFQKVGLVGHNSTNESQLTVVERGKSTVKEHEHSVEIVDCGKENLFPSKPTSESRISTKPLQKVPSHHGVKSKESVLLDPELNGKIDQKAHALHQKEKDGQCKIECDFKDLDSNSSQDCSSYYTRDISLQTSLVNSTSLNVNSSCRNSSSSQDCSSYYVQDASLQTSLVTCQSSQKYCSGSAKHCSSIKNQKTPNLGASPVILAADSGSSSCSDKEEHLVLESDVDDSNEDNPPQKPVSERDIAVSENNFDRVECDTGADFTETAVSLEKMTIHKDWSISSESSSGSPFISFDASKINDMSKGSEKTSSCGSNSRRKNVSDSSEDDQFDAFLDRLKAQKGEEKDRMKKTSSSLDDFIVDDGDEDGYDSTSSHSDRDENKTQHDDESEDDVLFHIKTDNILDKTKRRNRKPAEKTYHYYKSSSSDSVDESDSDLSDFVIEDTGKLTFSSDDSDEYYSKGKAESEGKSIGAGKFYVADSVASPLTENLIRPVENKGGNNSYKKDREDWLPPSTKTKKKTKPVSSTKVPKVMTKSSSLPANDWSTDSDDDFVVGRKDTPSNGGSLPLPFKTPRPIHKSADTFVTPISTKGTGSSVHPWTAPRHLQPSRNSLSDDKSYFLKSLSSDYPDFKRHPEAARYVKNFKSLRQDLTNKLFSIFNDAVFDSKLPSTLLLEWNVRYTKTAGTFSCRRKPSGLAKITLSNKVCDRPERVRDTLAHELCHAAVTLISEAREAHGPVWKSWARKVTRTFSFMPVVTRCHDYNIHNKYTYQCVNCKYRIGRHSKSLDTSRKVCGHCKGEFQVFLTSELNSTDCSTPVTPRTPRTPNKFALFVKECYSEVKKRNVDLKHGDIMKELSKDFAEKNKIKT